MDEKYTIEYSKPDNKKQPMPDAEKQPERLKSDNRSAKSGHDSAGHAGKPPKIVLPFGKRKKEVGEVVYDRRVPILITAVVYLSLAVVAMSSKIIFDRKSEPKALEVDVVDLEELARELEEAQKLNDMLNSAAPAEPVRNIVSNSAADRSDLRNYRQPTNRSQEYLEQSHEIDRRMAESREIYEQQLLAVEQQALSSSSVSTERNNPVRVDGAVSVSYTIVNPVREARDLFIPAYKCRAGGTVVVDVVVDRNGMVVNAEVAGMSAGADDCMMDTAVDAALHSRFNVDGNAPARHEGRITYNFVPQR